VNQLIMKKRSEEELIIVGFVSLLVFQYVLHQMQYAVASFSSI